MIYLLGHLLEGGFRAWSFLRLLDYLSVRAIGAAMLAFILMLVVMPKFIWYLHRRGLVDQTRDTGVPSAFDKAGTPVMGGAVMVGCILASCLVWADPANRYLLAVIVGLLWFAAIGLSDDLAKWRARSGNRGMSEARKLVLQGAFALLFVGFLASPWSPLPARDATTIYLPFVKRAIADSPWLYFPMVWLFVMGFLWFNAYPAQVFMGDAGSLAIGGCLATLSVLVKQEALFLILGGLFIVEALTSQIQDKVGIKWLGRRLFYRAPLHHQLQHTGVAETKVVIRLWIVSLILALVSVATIKLR
ncbi:MAG: hypothetical protein MUF60_10460 [Vicinamibacterales bacterium]|nr:hypothetical protein [Vicinamibacterales bacterium]